MSDKGYGQQDPSDSTSDHNVVNFHIRQELALLSTAKLVQIIAVDKDAKTVDAKPLVKLLDGANNASSQDTIYGLPYSQMQWGSSAIVGTPVVGDKGLIVCADRDGSAVVSNKGEAPPGSARKMSASDGLYIGGLPALNDAPTQTIELKEDGVDMELAHGNKLTSGATGWEFTGPVKFNGLVSALAGMQLAGNIAAVGGGRYSGNFDTSGTITSGLISLTGHHHTAQGATAATTAAQP